MTLRIVVQATAAQNHNPEYILHDVSADEVERLKREFIAFTRQSAPTRGTFDYKDRDGNDCVLMVHYSQILLVY